MEDLAALCLEQTGRGEEMQCLQDNLERQELALINKYLSSTFIEIDCTGCVPHVRCKSPITLKKRLNMLTLIRS